jgi:hypothetical protein
LPHSTFRRYVREGIYDKNWASDGVVAIDKKFGE